MVNIIASDYQVLRDGELRLEDGESKQLSFHLQNAFHYSNALRNHGVLNFNIRPANGGRLTVRVNGNGPSTIINRRYFSESHTRMHQEAFDLDAIVAAQFQSAGMDIGSFPIEFRAEDGPLFLSDIVIHYKVIIPIP
jgi:hypothetical protein